MWATEWNVNTDGNWGTAGNWDPPSVPNSSSTSVAFGSVITAPREVTVNGTFSVDNLTFDNANSYTLSGGTLNVNGDIISSSGVHTVTSNLNIGSGSIVNNSGGTLTLGGAVNGTSLNLTGTGTVLLSGTTNAPLISVISGTLETNKPSNLQEVSILLNGGTLLITEDAAFSANISAVTNPSSIDVSPGKTASFFGFASNTTTITKLGDGTLSLSTGGFTNPFIISGGTLAGDSTSMSFDITNNSTVNFSGLGGAYSNTLSGTGNVIVSSAEEVTFSGTNTYSGGTTVESGGSLRVSSDGNFGTGALTLDGGTLHTTTGFTSAKGVTLAGSGGTFNTEMGTLILPGVVTGPGSLIKTGAGEVALNNSSNDYSGGTIINQGIIATGANERLGAPSGGVTLNGGNLETTGTFTTARTLTMTGNGILSVDGGTTLTWNGTVSGSGQIRKIGNGNLVLGADNSGFSGGINFFVGTTSVSTTNNLGDGTGAFLFNNSALLETTGVVNVINPITLTGNGGFDTGAITTVSGNITGPGTLLKQGADTLILSGSNSYTGGITLSAGTIEGTTSSILGNIANSGTLTFNQNSDSEYAGLTSGSGSLTKTGTGTVILSGANTYTGGTTVSTGTLSISSNANLGDNSGGLTLDGGTLTTTAGFSSSRGITLGALGGTFNTVSGVISLTGTVTGAGALIKSGPGELILSNNSNDYLGGTQITQGVLAVGDNPRLGDLGGSVTFTGGSLETTGTFTTNRALIMTGPGTLSTDTNTTLTWNGTISGLGQIRKIGFGTVSLGADNSGFTGGFRFVVGTTSISNANNLGSGTLEFSGGNLETTGAVTASNPITLLDGGGIFDIGTDSSFSGSITGTGALSKEGAAKMTLLGTNNYTGGTIISAGTLEGDTDGLQGIITNNAAVIFDQTAAGTYAGMMSGIGSLEKQGAGTLTLTSLNSYSGGTTVSAGTLQGNTTSLQGAIDNNSNVTFDQSSDGEYADVMSGTGTLTKVGSSTLTLSGTNTYSGGTEIDVGAVSVSANANLGSGSGGLTLNGSTLITTAGFSISRGTTLDAGGGTFDTTGTLIHSGLITGTGTLTKAGPGVLSLTNNSNDYSGGTDITQGVVATPTDEKLGALSGAVTLSGGGSWEVTSSFSSDRDVIFAGPGMLSVDPGRTLTLNTGSGSVSGTGKLEKVGSGTLVLDGTNTSYSGEIFLSIGTISFSDPDNLGTGTLVTFGQGTLLASATLTLPSTKTFTLSTSGTLSTADTFTVEGIISGGGTLIKEGVGTVILTGTNNYTGGTTVSAGTLQGDTDSFQGAITNNAAVIFDQGSAGTYAGAMSGTGSLEKTGAGTLTLAGANSYSGGTTVDIGTLSGNTTSLQGAITALGGTTVNFNQGSSGTYSGAMTGGGTLTKTGGGTLTLTGANGYTGGTTVSAGILAGSPTGIQGAISNSAIVNFNQGTGTYSGVMSGSGHVIVSSTDGPITFSGANTYLGGTKISGNGNLIIASEVNLGTGGVTFDSGTLTNTAAFASAKTMTLSGDGTFETDFPLTLSGKITDDGRLIKTGSSILLLTGTTNDYTGGTLVSSGTLEGTGETIQGDVTNNATVNFNQMTANTYGGSMEGSGLLLKSGTGTLTLSGPNNTYTGGTTVTAGTLQGTSTSLQGTITNSGATVTFDQDFNGTFSGSISGTGSLFKEGTGTLSVMGSSPFTGTSTINGGEVNLNGSIAGPVITSTEGTLSGNGAVASLTNSGTTSPGNSIGTTTVGGNFTQGASGNVIIEIDDAGNADLVDVGGIASLAGTVTISPLPGVYSGDIFYTFLTATGGVTGTFGQELGPAGTTFAILYLPSSVLLDFSFAGSILPVPIDDLKGNAKEVAKYLFCEGAVSDPDLLSLLKQIVRLPAKEFVEELDQLSPAQFGALPLINLQNSHLMSDLFVTSNERTYWCDQECDGNTRLWIAPVGQWQGQTSIGQQLGFNSRTFGVALGASHILTHFLNATVGAGYTYTDLGWKNNGGSGHWNSIYLCPSVGYVSESWFGNALIQGAVNFYNIERRIRFTGISRDAKNSHHSYDILGRIDGGYRLKWGDTRKDYRLYTMPTVRLSYLNIFQNSYTERGAGVINLAIDSQYSAFLQPEVLIKNVLEFTPGDLCISPYNEIGYGANIPLTSASYTSRFHKQTLCKSNFTVVGFNETTNQLLFNFGLQITKGCNFSLDMSYNGRFFDQTYINAGKLKFDYRF
ncbi:autotransporter-associated beta strand repeat-containing protein [Candidatus Neptunochlamydia vexilliferae]|uniref:autotransporter-associated beta strand repeat-containing protein n=1 Tax=Candidatus Neptunichlamydia vexilliferae TaxID=1651774 RepID=UPI001891CF9B|nr:autotransporter-associated beta strand repeat-containing protein [Candidatus Neptunochlamydia vexilliferae]